MNLVCVLSGIGLLLAITAAQYPKPCVSPPLLTGGITLLAGELSATGRVSYDSYGNKVRVRYDGTAGNGTFSLDYLMLFNEEYYYEIDWHKYYCRKKQLYSGFTPLQVPSDATPGGQAILGTSSAAGMGLLVNNWMGKLLGNGSYYTTFTEFGCIPMTYSGYHPFLGSIFVSTYNWVAGITDPNELQPPFICNFAQLEKSDTPDDFFSALVSGAKQTPGSN